MYRASVRSRIRRNIEAGFHQTPDAERAAQDAHVGMDAHNNHVSDAVLLQQMKYFPPVVADGVRFRNVQCRDAGASMPYTVGRRAGHRSRYPNRLWAGEAREKDRVSAMFRCHRVGPNGRRVLGALSLRRVRVEIKGIARRMNNECPPLSEFPQNNVHARNQFVHAPRRACAPVLVPHIAHNDGGFGSFPFHRRINRLQPLRCFLPLLPFCLRERRDKDSVDACAGMAAATEQTRQSRTSQSGME